MLLSKSLAFPTSFTKTTSTNVFFSRCLSNTALRSVSAMSSSSSSSSSSSFNNPNLLYNRTTTTTTTTTSSLHHDYYALRHGQSMANVAGIIASNPDIACQTYGLSEVGMDQAKQAGQDVLLQLNQNYDGVVILTSDLLRAQETATFVKNAVLGTGKLYQNDIIIETRLRERWFGDWDLTSDDNYQKVWNDDVQDASHTLHNVESVHSVMYRATQAIVEWDEKLAAQQQQQQQQNKKKKKYMVITVAHGDVLQILQTAFEQMDGTQHRTLPHLETAKLRPLVLKTKITTPKTK